MADRNRFLNHALAGILLAPIPFLARAETYLTETQAAAVFFPGIKMQPRWMDLSAQEMKAIYEASSVKPPEPRARVLWGPHHEAIFIDRVLGKHEFITYAVGIDANGAVKGVEIMEYRETYGEQIREKQWRQHFVGKTSKNALKLDRDIPNISGATLSSKHVTEGVRRLLQTYELLKAKA